MQRDALLKAGVLPDNIHEEHVSGVAKNRPAFEAAKLDAVAGDTFIVWKLDRLGRSAMEIMKNLAEFEERGVRVRSLTEVIDTSTAAGEAMTWFCAVMAQLERALIRERTNAAVAHRKAKGGKFGPPRKVDVEKAIEMFLSGMQVPEVAKAFDCSKQAVYSYFDWATVTELIEAGREAREGKRGAAKRLAAIRQSAKIARKAKRK